MHPWGPVNSAYDGRSRGVIPSFYVQAYNETTKFRRTPHGLYVHTTQESIKWSNASFQMLHEVLFGLWQSVKPRLPHLVIVNPQPCYHVKPHPRCIITHAAVTRRVTTVSGLTHTITNYATDLFWSRAFVASDACRHVHNTIKNVTPFEWMLSSLKPIIKHFSKSTISAAHLLKKRRVDDNDETVKAFQKIGKTSFGTH
ncbi:uncharacterized protein EDB91DRAFT_1087702 [Suillus paluster]|uniref:uncharacterized protein n=1 Tax=Suillus paluster TaxID=48578 RepID=UPI001B872953|nr:uncharacterized protein EDB91DRAFT_1087702 [Suillus paluster]KAG1723784.1 hypothetical protein EDB91DRAFT_1087702 [Suillus paluster]